MHAMPGGWHYMIQAERERLFQMFWADEMNYDPGLCAEIIEQLSDDGIVTIDWTRIPEATE